jgi:hypothetical protein
VFGFAHRKAVSASGGASAVDMSCPRSWIGPLAAAAAPCCLDLPEHDGFAMMTSKGVQAKAVHAKDVGCHEARPPSLPRRIPASTRTTRHTLLNAAHGGRCSHPLEVSLPERVAPTEFVAGSALSSRRNSCGSTDGVLGQGSASSFRSRSSSSSEDEPASIGADFRAHAAVDRGRFAIRYVYFLSERVRLC